MNEMTIKSNVISNSSWLCRLIRHSTWAERYLFKRLFISLLLDVGEDVLISFKSTSRRQNRNSYKIQNPQKHPIPTSMFSALKVTNNRALFIKLISKCIMWLTLKVYNKFRCLASFISNSIYLSWCLWHDTNCAPVDEHTHKIPAKEGKTHILWMKMKQ